MQAALRNLEVALEPVLKLTAKELADQASLDHHSCQALSAVYGDSSLRSRAAQSCETGQARNNKCQRTDRRT